MFAIFRYLYIYPGLSKTKRIELPFRVLHNYTPNARALLAYCLLIYRGSLPDFPSSFSFGFMRPIFFFTSENKFYAICASQLHWEGEKKKKKKCDFGTISNFMARHVCPVAPGMHGKFSLKEASWLQGSNEKGHMQLVSRSYRLDWKWAAAYTYKTAMRSLRVTIPEVKMYLSFCSPGLFLQKFPPQLSSAITSLAPVGPVSLIPSPFVVSTSVATRPDKMKLAWAAFSTQIGFKKAAKSGKSLSSNSAWRSMRKN